LPKIKQHISGDSLTPANKQKGNKKCNFCYKEKKLIDFYISKSPLYSIDGRVPICKECVISNSLNDDGTINEIKLNEILKMIDKPYYKDSLEASVKSFKKENSYVMESDVPYYGKEILQKYFKQIAMQQDRSKSYDDSEKEGFIHLKSNTKKRIKDEITKKYSDIKTASNIQADPQKSQNTQKYKIHVDDFEITDEMVGLLGDGFTKEEYKKMFEKYKKLRINYSLQTNLHQEALVTYVRFKVKEEIATAEGNVEEAKKWYDAAQKAASDAKLTPKQLTQADLHGGINSFSEIFKAVEQAVDIIPILPQFKYRPNDACDFIIWCYINYIRDLQGLPQCEYEDVYKFYDKRKGEYIEQYGDPYGIFDEDPTEEMRPNIKKFITLPKDYHDMGV